MRSLPGSTIRRPLPPPLNRLADSQLTVTNFALGQPTLDEVFLALTGRPAEPESPVDPELEEPAV